MNEDESLMNSKQIKDIQDISREESVNTIKKPCGN